MPQSRLVPGGYYTIPIKITNISPTFNYTVKNGTYVVVLRSENNHEVFKKEITGIAIAAGEEMNLQETFVFNPVETGRYTLEYSYTDETGVITGFFIRFLSIRKRPPGFTGCKSNLICMV